MSITEVAEMQGWLRPRGFGDPAHARWTRLGTLDGPGEPLVDGSGVVQVAPGRPTITWWIAGDDRWYCPSREVTVRQSLLMGTPVVETRMRIKGGDVCHRAYAVMVPVDGVLREAVVLEVENTTGVPCGVAFALRPFGIVDPAPVHRVSLEGSVLRADGLPALILPRPPAAAIAGDFAGGDLLEAVTSGRAVEPTFAPLSCPAGFAQAAVVVPIAHRASFRAIVPVPGGPEDGIFDVPAAVPGADAVARGWRLHVRDAARVNVPDPRLQAVLDASPAWLCATTSAPESVIGRSIWDNEMSPRWNHVAAIAGALDRFGLHDRSGTLLAGAAAAYSSAAKPGATWLVDAFGAHLARTRDAAFARAVAEVTATILSETSQLDASDGAPGGPRTFNAAATVFDAADEQRAAKWSLREGERRASEKAFAAVSADPVDALGSAIAGIRHGAERDAFAMLDGYLDAVTGTGVWPGGPDAPGDRHSVGVGALVASLGCDLLVHANNGRVHFVAHVPANWLGTSFEAHGVVTEMGRSGFAVRWHGNRPALLWETEAIGTVRDRIGAPGVDALGLDATWRGEGGRGEALLGAIAEAESVPRPGARIIGLSIGSPRGTGSRR